MQKKGADNNGFHKPHIVWAMLFCVFGAYTVCAQDAVTQYSDSILNKNTIFYLFGSGLSR